MSVVTRSRGRSFLVGVGLIAFVVLLMYVAITAPKGHPFSTHTTVRAAFTDVGQLQPGDDVRENSVRVGQVSDIEFHNGTAVVTMSLLGRQSVYADARAAMWDQSALGQKFVELDPGAKSSGALGNAVIPTTRTTGAMDIDQLLDVFDSKTRAATGSAVRELGTGVAGQSQALNGFLTHAPEDLSDFSSLSRRLASDQTDLPALLRSARDLSAQLSEHTTDLRSLLQRTDDTLSAVGVDRSVPLASTVAQLPETLSDVRTVSDHLSVPLTDVHRAVARLRPGVTALGAATPALRSLLRNGVTPLGKVPTVAHQAVPAVDDLTTTLTTAQPVVPKVDMLVKGLDPFLTRLAPYSVDIHALAVGGASFTNDPVTDANGMVYNHVLIFPVITYATAAGLLSGGYDPYPKPGTATQDGSNVRSPVDPLLGADR